VAEPATPPAAPAYSAPVLEEPRDVSMVEAVQVQDVPEAPERREPVPPTFETREIGEAEREYVGAPINFSLRDADLKEVLRTFAKISGLNMVVQPGVDGRVTVELTGVPWDQALEIILKTQNLGYQLEGNIMRIAPLSVLGQEAAAEAAQRQAAALAVPLRTVLKRVSYASAAEIMGLLRSGTASILSARGSVVVDQRTNTLIIKELPDYMDTVLAIIDQVDVAEPQVMIEARIVETTKRFNRSVGISWNFDAIADAAHGNTTGLVFPNNAAGDGGVNLLTGGNNGFLNLTLGNVLNTFNIDMALQAAESEGLINILSAPKVATLNNVQASIQSGLQIPVQTVANNTVTVQFVNATLRLDVTPHVTADGTVLMDIQVQKREPQLAFAIVGATNAPIATREAQTRVIVRDGGTAVIGGIYQVTNDRGEDRVPGLADIPILGHLFKNRRNNNNTEELLIFITPRVIKL
jgi:type IV pilus assembly protein PilQ